MTGTSRLHRRGRTMRHRDVSTAGAGSTRIGLCTGMVVVHTIYIRLCSRSGNRSGRWHLVVYGGLMVTWELTGTIHGTVATRHSLLLLMVVRWMVLLLLLLMLKARPGSRSSHVIWMMVVMMRDWIAGPKIKLWCRHTRLTGRRWSMHALMVHMIGMRGWCSRWTLTQW